MNSERYPLRDVLRVCGVSTSAPMIRKHHALLSVIRRWMKVEIAIIVDKNANRTFFDLAPEQTGQHSVVVSNDIFLDARVSHDNRDILYPYLRSYIGVSVRWGDRKFGTVIVGSSVARNFAPEDVSLVCDMCDAMKEISSDQQSTIVRTAMSSLSVCTVLLSSIKAYLEVATSCVRKMDYQYDQALSDNSLYARAAWKELENLTRQFENVRAHVESSIARALSVARHYSTVNRTAYLISCFPRESIGFMQSMNAVLLRLSSLMPDHNLMWSFRLDASLAHCAHRTFVYHLLFFLESLVFRWAPYCSSAQISLTFETKGSIEYFVPSSTAEQAKLIEQITNQSMLQKSSVARERGSPMKGPDFSSCGTSSPDTPTKKAKGSIRFGNLRVFFQPLEVTYFDKEHPRPRQQRETEQSSAESSLSSVGAGASATSSTATAAVLPMDGMTAPPCPRQPMTTTLSRSLQALTSSMTRSSASSSASHLYRVAPSPTSSTETAAQSSAVSSPRRTSSPPSAPHGRGLRRAASTLYSDYEELMNQSRHLSPYATTQELMQVLNDFLVSVDPHSRISIVSSQYSHCLVEPQSVAFMITLPCYFILPVPDTAEPGVARKGAPTASSSTSPRANAPSRPDNGQSPRKVFQSVGRMNSRMISVEESEELETGAGTGSGTGAGAGGSQPAALQSTASSPLSAPWRPPPSPAMAFPSRPPPSSSSSPSPRTLPSENGLVKRLEHIENARAMRRKSAETIATSTSMSSLSSEGSLHSAHSRSSARLPSMAKASPSPSQRPRKTERSWESVCKVFRAITRMMGLGMGEAEHKAGRKEGLARSGSSGRLTSVGPEPPLSLSFSRPV